MKGNKMMKKLRFWISAVLFSLILGQTVCAIESGGGIFVSPNGNDAGDGVSVPVQSLERAQELARRMGPGTVVTLEEGCYVVPNSLSFTAEDSGTTAKPVQYRGKPGARVSVTSGLVLDPAQFGSVTDPEALERLPVSAREQVRVMDLSGFLDKTDAYPDLLKRDPGTTYYQLLVDGQRRQLARYPNDGRYACTAGRLDESDRAFTVADAEIERLESWAKEAEHMVCAGYFGVDWNYNHVRVESVNADEKTVSLRAKPQYGVGRTADRYCVLNMICELDSPGEWYLDLENRMLYYYPEEETAGQIILATGKTPILTGENTRSVTFQNIHFLGSRNSGAVFKNSSDICFGGCTFSGFGKDALELSDCSDCSVRSCTLFQLGGRGILLNGGDPVRLLPGGNVAENCRIYAFGQDFRSYAGAVELSGHGNYAIYNEIYDSPHLAIRFSGNDHMIAYNEIHHVVQESTDAGAIYACRSWIQRGTRIMYNYLHDIVSYKDMSGSTSAVDAVYLDDMFSGTVVESNVFQNCTRAVHVGGGRNNVCRYNILIDCGRGLYYDNRAMNEQWAHYHVEKDGTVYKEAKALLSHPNFQAERWYRKYPGFDDLVTDLLNYDMSLETENLGYDTGIPSGLMTDNVFIGNGLNIENGRLGYISVYPEIEGNRGAAFTWDSAGFSDPENGDFSLTANSMIPVKLPNFPGSFLQTAGRYRDEFQPDGKNFSDGRRTILAVRNSEGVLESIRVFLTQIPPNEIFIVLPDLNERNYDWYFWNNLLDMRPIG